MSSTASPPDPSDDSSAVAGAASSNFALLYVIIAVLVGVILYMAVRYGRSVLSEWRQLQAAGAGHGASPTRLGLSMDDIAALPMFTFRAPAPSPHGSVAGGGRRSGSGKGKSVVECVVCLPELEDGDVVRVLPACRHFFHGSCIDVWLCAHSTCPVCRAHPEPERARVGEVTVSPPLPQLRRCDASPERPASSRVLVDILARSPLRSSCSTSASKEIVSKSPSPGPTAREYIMLRSPSPTPPTHGRVNERCSKSPPPRMPEIVVVRSMSPSARSVGVLEGTEVITSASPYPVTAREDGCGSLSKSPSPVPHYVVAEERQQQSFRGI